MRFSTLLLAATVLCASSPFPTAMAAVPAAVKTQAPGYYRMALGDFTVTALYDGYIKLDKNLLKGIDDAQKQAYLAQAFLDYGQGVQTAVNGFLIHTGEHLVLVDAGAAKKFGPTLGNIADAIRQAGHDPKEVDVVLLTHLHPDHASGLQSPDGKVLFPNATVYATQAEADYWLSPKNAAAAAEGKKPMFALSQEAIAPYRQAGKFKTFEPGDEIAGVKAVSSVGHTPGHTGYLFTSKGEELLVWGDIVHSHSIQFQNPDVSLEFDSDQPTAVATRKKQLAEAASRKFWVAGAHLPFPGIGHVRKDGTAYRWVPVEFGPVEFKSKD